MNHKKILSIFLVLVSLFTSVGVSSNLTCFAEEYYNEAKQKERDNQETKRPLKLIKKVEAEPVKEKQKSPSLWSYIALCAIICGTSWALTSTFCFTFRNSNVSSCYQFWAKFHF